MSLPLQTIIEDHKLQGVTNLYRIALKESMINDQKFLVSDHFYLSCDFACIEKRKRKI